MRDWEKEEEGEGEGLGRGLLGLVFSLLVRESPSSFRSTIDREAEDGDELETVVRDDAPLGAGPERADVEDSRIGVSSPGESGRGEAARGEPMEVATDIFRECGCDEGI